MTTDRSAGIAVGPRPTASAPRVWPAVVLVGLLWGVYLALRWTELGPLLGFAGFLAQLAATALVTLLYFTWWLSRRQVRGIDRLLAFGPVLAGAVLAALVADSTLDRSVLMVMGLLCVLTSWTAGLMLTRGMPAPARRLGLVGLLLATWGAFLLIRQEGRWGDGQADFQWRWTSSAEQRYLAGPRDVGAASPPAALSLRPGDWPGFRGPERDGVVRGVRIATEWDAEPPKLIWRRPIGPAWSSVAVVGDRLFTQEQVGHNEAVVCLDAGTGHTLWSHEDAARHWDSQGVVGPRATPAFAAGLVFSLGATGILNGLDAATGERKWSRDLGADAGAPRPMWGFSCSPLVVDGLVVVFAGGPSEKTLLAYHAESGEPAWAAPAGRTSYSSPHLTNLGGDTQVLLLSDRGLTALAPASGSVLWQYELPARGPGMPQSIQPHPAGASQFVIDGGPDQGAMLVEVTRDGGGWKAAQRWASRQLKPAFNDLVVHGGCVYGFDGGLLTCIDLQTGKRRWKDGRYGSGQVLLLADQSLLLVMSERGEAVLVAADPARHEERGRFQAVTGKTWNHPVIAHGRLYVRNAEEMACYELN
jgi:outer membrane protein assembly factor BamB